LGHAPILAALLSAFLPKRGKTRVVDPFPMKAYIPTSPLALAVQGKHVEAAVLLLECGATTRHSRSVRQEKPSEGYRYRGYGESERESVTTVYDALLDAAKTGCLGMVAALLPVAASEAGSTATAVWRQPVAANATAAVVAAAAAESARCAAEALSRAAAEFARRRGEALYSAAALGFVDIVAFLLSNAELEPPVLGRALRDAVGHGHIDVARLLLERGAPVQYDDVRLQCRGGIDHDHEGEGVDIYRNALRVPRSSLAVAAGLGRTDIVLLLLSHGPALVDVNGWHYERTNGLCVHDQSNYYFTHVDPYSAKKDGVDTTYLPFTALHAATRRGDLELMQVLLQHGAYTNILRSLPTSLPTERHYRRSVNKQTSATCMREALIAGNTDALRLLLAHSEHLAVDCLLLLPVACRLPARPVEDNGCSDDSDNGGGNGGDGDECKEGCPEMVRLLLDVGSLSPAQLDAADLDHGVLTPLRHAFDSRHIAIMALLMDRGATLGAMHPLDVKSPLFHLTNSLKSIKVAEFLLDRGEDVHAKDERGGTLLMAACRRGDSSSDISVLLLSLLVARGAAVNAVDTMGITALHAACASGSHPTASVPLFLLTHGADVNALCNRQRTSLHYACLRAGLGNGESPRVRRSGPVVKCLLARGAQVDCVDASGRTALHHACEGKDAQSVARLIVRGASANAVDTQRNTPLHLVCSHDDRNGYSPGQDSVDIVKLLLQCPDIHADAVNEAGDTPLLCAMTVNILDTQFAEVAALLVRHGVFLNVAHPSGDTPLVRLVGVLNTVRGDYQTSGRHMIALMRLMLDSGANPTHVTGHASWPQWGPRLR
jgi:ankyrin repeat protein